MNLLQFSALLSRCAGKLPAQPRFYLGGPEGNGLPGRLPLPALLINPEQIQALTAFHYTEFVFPVTAVSGLKGANGLAEAQSLTASFAALLSEQPECVPLPTATGKPLPAFTAQGSAWQLMLHCRTVNLPAV